MRINKDHVIILAVLLGALGAWLYSQRPMFPELQGPSAATRLPLAADFALDMAQFPQHGESALALVVNDPASSWYGIASGLGSMGIPFRIYTDVEAALEHEVVMVYPTLSGANTSAASLQALAAHVREGRTLLAFAVLGGGMQDIFGFEAAVEHSDLRALQFAQTEFTREFARNQQEAWLDLGAGEVNSGSPGISYANPKHPPLATYDDGSAAITHNFFDAAGGTGHAYALGLDLGHYILHAHNGRYFSTDDNYVNTYYPQIDTMLRFVSKVYREAEDGAVLISPTPAGKDVTILMTHDIDFTRSIVNAPAYAEVERAAGVPATYFIQTKYVRDYSDDYFLDPERAAHLRELVAMGMEIGSHSVAHSRVFENLDAGSGTEQYPEYRPFVDSLRSVRGATIAGELRVSKFLLEALTGETVVSFRPGHLSHPRSLPQMLRATGFTYSSSMTANEALTHLPFRPMYDRGYELPVDVYEFPVTIEDEKGRLGDRLDEAIAVTRAIARYHGLVTVLVHTDILDHKLEFTRDYIAAFRDSAWFATVRDYGAWWAARDTVALDVTQPADGGPVVRVSAAAPIDGLTLELPDGWTYLNRNGPAGTRQQGQRLTLGGFSGETTLEFQSTVRTRQTAE